MSTFCGGGNQLESFTESNANGRQAEYRLKTIFFPHSQFHACFKKYFITTSQIGL